MFNYLINKYPTQVDLMKNTEQDKEFHAEGNVYVHTKMAFNTLLSLKEFKECNEEEKGILMYAIFFHDIGKSKTSHFEGGHIRSRGHSRAGEKMTQELLYYNEYEFNFRKEVCSLIKYHGFPVFSLEKSIHEIAEISLAVNTKLLYILTLADMLGRITDKESMENSLINIHYFKEICEQEECFGKPKSFASNNQKMFYLSNGYMHEPFNNKCSTVYLLSGLPGSGKDFFIKEKLSWLPIISLDDMRREKKAKRKNTKLQGQIIQEAKLTAKKYLAEKKDFVWNATNISSSLRSSLIELFRDYGASVNIIYIEVPYKKLLKQNSNREFPVPEEVIKELVWKLDLPIESECHSVEYVTI